MYDTERRLTTVINPQGLTWQYTRDPRGLVTAETDFNAAVTTFERDPAGHVIRQVNAVGQTLTYTHDPNGNVVAEHAGDGATTHHTYDPNGLLARATTPDVDLTLTRDPLGRITAETVNGHTLSTTYDLLGHPVLRRTPSGALSRWDHDPAGRPVQLANDNEVLTFGWDTAGRQTSRRFGATTLQQAFDPVGRLLTQTLTTTNTPTTSPEPAPGRPAATPRLRLQHRRTPDRPRRPDRRRPPLHPRPHRTGHHRARPGR